LLVYKVRKSGHCFFAVIADRGWLKPRAISRTRPAPSRPPAKWCLRTMAFAVTDPAWLAEYCLWRTLFDLFSAPGTHTPRSHRVPVRRTPPEWPGSRSWKRRCQGLNAFTFSLPASGQDPLRGSSATLRVPSDAGSARSEYPGQTCASHRPGSGREPGRNC